MTATLPSFTDLLAPIEITPDGLVLLEDHATVAVGLEIDPIGCEARSHEFLAALRDKLTLAIDALPETTPPWVLQLYVEDRPGVGDLAAQVREYAVAPSPLLINYTEHLHRHTERLSRPGGLFVDPLSGSPWRGQRRTVRAVLYRRHNGDEPNTGELASVETRVTEALRAGGVAVRRMDRRQWYDWLAGWIGSGMPYEDDSLQDFSESLLHRCPESHDGGVWVIDGDYHRCMTIQALRQTPTIGHLTGERQVGDLCFALFDRLPEGAVLAITIVATPQDHVENHLTALQKNSTGKTAVAQITAHDAAAAQLKVAQGDRLLHAGFACYLRADTPEVLADQVDRTEALLLANGLQPLAGEHDIFALDAFVRNLPGGYHAAADKLARRCKLQFTQHLANLLPVYGRSRGTGHPGVLFYSRTGEPVTFDPLNKHDRVNNGFGFLLGPSGSGKSATLCYMLTHWTAVHRPRLFVIEKGGSMALLAQYLEHNGCSVRNVTMDPKADVSLPPFADADRIDADDNPEARDYLGECELAAELMITGGDPAERLTRADRETVREAIRIAGERAREVGRTCTVTDVADALAPLDEPRAKALRLFTSGVAGYFFNRPGQPWPDVDASFLELGILASEGRADQMVLAVVGLVNQIIDTAERDQYTGRPILIVIDEAHLLMSNPLLARYLAKVVKMFRKLGVYIWLATQNLTDFAGESAKLLGNIEWWLSLNSNREQVDQIGRFRELTDEQRALLLAPRKAPGRYVEGVVLSPGLSMLYRNVPPPLALALAQTEAHEKAARREIMNEHGCTELEAALSIAASMEANQ